MYFILYETTNLINNKKYIGVHKTIDLNDGYLGSGIYLRNAIKKYGKENFKKVILDTFDTIDEAFVAEKNKVTEDIVNSDEYYNLRIGGSGGSNKGHLAGIPKTESHKQAISESLSNRQFSESHKASLSESKQGKKLSKDHCESISKAQKKNGNNGKYERTDEIKEKQRLVRKNQRWINNGKERKMVHVDELDNYINDGWSIGKKI